MAASGWVNRVWRVVQAVGSGGWYRLSGLEGGTGTRLSVQGDQAIGTGTRLSVQGTRLWEQGPGYGEQGPGPGPSTRYRYPVPTPAPSTQYPGTTLPTDALASPAGMSRTPTTRDRWPGQE